ncbi:MAG: hypothetical protein QFF03_22280 [Pseudomonadota bacterium]|nr:hypothetical protein [Pseudomonadota bacterium]
MRFTDETLMAYADGELDEPTRSAVERAIRADPVLAAKVRRHAALRHDVFQAFAHTLDEPVPPRLMPVGHSAKVVQLDAVRAARKHVVEVPRRWSWPEWGAIAATLVVGVLVGSMGLRSLQGETQLASSIGSHGVLTARGPLDAALTHQLASAPPASAGVRIGVSFVARDGQYCRSFAMAAASGLACRSGGEWTIPVLAQGAAADAGAQTYRQAGSTMAPAVLEAIDARAQGASLDAKAEQAAAQRGWTR